MRRIVGQLLIALALISASIGSPVAGAAGDVGRIKNLIVIYQENHAFDSYFANFPGADGFLNTPSAVVPQVEKCVLSPAGHMLHHDQPEALAERLEAFLDAG